MCKFNALKLHPAIGFELRTSLLWDNHKCSHVAPPVVSKVHWLAFTKVDSLTCNPRNSTSGFFFFFFKFYHYFILLFYFISVFYHYIAIYEEKNVIKCTENVLGFF